MRWRFLDANNQGERAYRDVCLVKIDSWWNAFSNQTQQLSQLFAGTLQWDLPQWMAMNLQAIDSRLMWEFGPALEGRGHRLVITPETARHLRPLIATILERAPRIEGWEFYDYRLPEDLETTRLSVKQRTQGDIDAFSVAVRRGDHHRIDLRYMAQNATDAQAVLNSAFIATEGLLGEACLDKWIGAIDVAPAPSGLRALFRRKHDDLKSAIPLHRMRETVESLIGSIRDQLPRRPHHELIADAEWTLWQLSPEPADDYPGQLDLAVGKSANPGVWVASHSGDAFYSERFSSCGEIFCYLKVDGAAPPVDMEFADKEALEDAISATLIPAKLGCQIGGGSGMRYAYFDLALTKFDEGIRALRKRLQAGKVPKRSWLLFFDAEFAHEWIGVYDDSPPPPLPIDASCPN